MSLGHVDAHETLLYLGRKKVVRDEMTKDNIFWYCYIYLGIYKCQQFKEGGVYQFQKSRMFIWSWIAWNIRIVLKLANAYFSAVILT